MRGLTHSFYSDDDLYSYLSRQTSAPDHEIILDGRLLHLALSPDYKYLYATVNMSPRSSSPLVSSLTPSLSKPSVYMTDGDPLIPSPNNGGREGNILWRSCSFPQYDNPHSCQRILSLQVQFHVERQTCPPIPSLFPLERKLRDDQLLFSSLHYNSELAQSFYRERERDVPRSLPPPFPSLDSIEAISCTNLSSPCHLPPPSTRARVRRGTERGGKGVDKQHRDTTRE